MEYIELDKLFTYHPPKGDQMRRYVEIREAGLALARIIHRNTPNTPEQTLAIRDVQRATMMANAAIACNE